MFNYPRLFFLASLLVLWLAELIGVYANRRRPMLEPQREDFNIMQTATLTLLGLIIGFSFSMAVSRYDQRKNFEEAEANSIGTEYTRAALLPAPAPAEVRAMLRDYVNLRVAFYRERDEKGLEQIGADTDQLQNRMTDLILASAQTAPTPLTVLAVSGMNSVFDSRGDTLAAWRNRIPTSAWGLLIAIACCCNLLVGYGARNTRARPGMLLVLPIIISISFFLIADIDSPRRGFIHVDPSNLTSLQQSLR